MGLIGSSPTNITITANSLADGSGRASSGIDNTGEYNRAIISIRIKSGSTAPDDGGTYDVFLLRSDDAGGAAGDIADDNWAESDAAITPLNATPLGSIECTSDANTEFEKHFDTFPHALGPKWGIAILNNSGQTTATSGCYARYRYVVPDAAT